jgi:hypothetical protein
VIELDGKRIPLHVVDSVGNGKKGRPPRRPAPEKPHGPVDFDPGHTLVADTADTEEDSDGDLF